MCVFFQVAYGGIEKEKFLSVKRRKIFLSSPSPPIQLLPAYRCYHSRLYKKIKWCHRKADITSRSKWLEPIPGRTNEETCLITESIQNPSDFVILFRLLLNHITKQYSSVRDLICFVLFSSSTRRQFSFLFPFSLPNILLPDQCQNSGSDPPSRQAGKRPMVNEAQAQDSPGSCFHQHVSPQVVR